jgi:hypothetical protein
MLDKVYFHVSKVASIVADQEYSIASIIEEKVNTHKGLLRS